MTAFGNQLPVNTGTPREAVLSPHTSLPLSRTLEVRGEYFNVASDYHLPVDWRVIRAVIDEILRLKASDIFICAGDVFDAGEGEDRSQAISEFLSELAKDYSLVLYTPGNHCLRSREDPWASFHVGRERRSTQVLKHSSGSPTAQPFPRNLHNDWPP